MKKTYTVILNSALATNRTGANTSSYTYDIQWNKILPQEYKLFDLSYTFRTTTTNTVLSETIVIYSNIGNKECFNQNWNNSYILGSAIPNSYATNTANTQKYFYDSKFNDDNGCICYYPMNNYVSVNLYNLDGTAASNVPNYILQLYFTVIE